MSVIAVAVGVVFVIVCWWFLAVLWVLLLVFRLISLCRKRRMDAVGCGCSWVPVLFLCFCVLVLVLFVVFREVSFGVFLSALTYFRAAMFLIVFSGVYDAINVCSN